MAVPAIAAAAPPAIEAQWVSGVTSTNATLHAEINPNGQLTKYKLQIDTTGNFKFDQSDGCALHPPGWACTQAIVDGEPQPPGLVQPAEATLAAALTPRHVSIDLGSIGSRLQPETTYHYRAIAANEGGFVYGSAQTFTTPAAPDPLPPTIESAFVSDIAPTNATLHAEINPNGQLTKYKLQIDTTGNFKFDQSDGCVLHPLGIVCAAIFVPGEPQPPGLVQPPERTIWGGVGPQHVSVDLGVIGSVLQPETTYYFRAVAASGIPLVIGPTQTFTTPPAEVFVDPGTPEEGADEPSPEVPDEEPEDPPAEGTQEDLKVPPAEEAEEDSEVLPTEADEEGSEVLPEDETSGVRFPTKSRHPTPPTKGSQTPESRGAATVSPSPPAKRSCAKGRRHAKAPRRPSGGPILASRRPVGGRSGSSCPRQLRAREPSRP